MLMHLASLFFISNKIFFFFSTDLYVYTRFLCSDLKFLMWACLKPHFASYMNSSNSCLNAGFFNDRVQSGFSPSNSASIFVLYIQKTFTLLRLDVFVMCRYMYGNHTTSSYTRRENGSGNSIALTELTDCEFNYFELTQL